MIPANKIGRANPDKQHRDFQPRGPDSPLRSSAGILERGLSAVSNTARWSQLNCKRRQFPRNGFQNMKTFADAKSGAALASGAKVDTLTR
jgi:hypothetical protein